MRYKQTSTKTYMVAAVIAAASLYAGHPMPAQSSDSVSISISARITPIVDLQHGGPFNVVITVPDKASARGATIQPVRVPFTVTGNALASVTVKPDGFIKVDDDKFLGEARGPNGGAASLGYDILVQFPAPSGEYEGLPGRGGFGEKPKGDNYSSLPGGDGEGTPELTVNMVEHGQEVSGVIHIVSRQHWTAGGGEAMAGVYTGALQVIVMADTQ